MKVAIVVPVKQQTGAKTRLAPLLSPAERSRLAVAMLQDVARGLSGIGCNVVMITSCPGAAAFAARIGWRVFRETEQVSESNSVDLASKQMRAEGFQAVLRIPADIPLLRRDDLWPLLAAPIPGRFVALTPSWDGTGTNAILRSPPDLFPSRFGPNSFTLHQQEAHKAGADIRIATNEHIALDLDEPRDILRFLLSGSDTETYRLLVGLGVNERIAAYAG